MWHFLFFFWILVAIAVPLNDLKDSASFKEKLRTDNNCTCENPFLSRSAEIFAICSEEWEVTIILNDLEDSFLSLVNFSVYFYGAELNQQLVLFTYNNNLGIFEEYKVIKDSLSDKKNEEGFRVQKLSFTLPPTVKTIKIRNNGPLSVGITHFTTKSLVCPLGSAKTHQTTQFCRCLDGYYESTTYSHGFLCLKCPPYCVLCDSEGMCLSTTESFQNSK